MAAIIKTDQLWLDQTTSSAVGAPALIFGADSLSGLYSIGTNNIGLTINGTKLLDMSSGAVAITGTLSATGLISPAQTVGIVGTTTNNSVQAGSVGEILTATKARSDFTRLTTGTVTNIISISLTAGDWDVWGTAGYLGDATATLTTQLVASISTTSATLGAAETNRVRVVCAAFDATVGDSNLATPCVPISLASTTTVYVVGNVVFSTSTMTYYGSITARRRR